MTYITILQPSENLIFARSGPFLITYHIYIYIYMYRTRAFFSPQIVTQSKYKGQREIRSSTDCLLYIATVGVSLKSGAAVGRCTTGLKIITSFSSTLVPRGQYIYYILYL